MNVLIVNDDGFEAYGLQLLRNAVAAAWPGAQTITLCPKSPQSGVGMGIRNLSAEGPQNLRKYKVKGEAAWEISATPVELIYYGFMRSEEFLPRGSTFNLVLAGVNHGSNTGLNVFHSGTVGAAMFASKAFGACSVAFSQDYASVEDTLAGRTDNFGFESSERFLPIFLNQWSWIPGEAWNVNMPVSMAGGKGWKPTIVAPYNPFFTTPGEQGRGLTDSYRRNRGGLEDDVATLRAGVVSVTELCLNANVPLAF